MENPNLYYQFSIEETLDNLKTRKEGLSQEEVAERLQVYGENKLIHVNKIPVIFKFLSQFKDLMVIILIAAGTFSLYLGEVRDATIMYALVLINAVIGFVQEYKAEKVMDSLKTLVKAKAKVIRDGKTHEIDGDQLVPGDLVILEEGDAPPADVRIIQENELSTNDFSLTGESNPTRKFIHAITEEVQLGDRNNLAFMGTTIATGNGLGIVVSTGMHTEIGRIANLSQQAPEELSPLQKELNNLAKKVTKMIIVVASLLFGAGLYLNFGIRESMLFAIGVAASCIPEGLPAEVSVALSLASGRLAKQNAIVKKLSAVETLGATHIICTDKTGTLTKNEMTVQKLVIGDKIFDVSGLGYEPKGNILDSNGKALSSGELDKYMLFFEDGVFSSNAKISPPDAEHQSWYSIGDPTEAALITLAEKVGVIQKDLDRKSPELKEYTFDAVRKRMTSVRNRDGKMVAYVKGAPQSLLERCTHIFDGEKIRPITNEDKKSIEEKDSEFAQMAMRNLGYCYREIPEYTADMKMDDVEKGLTWLGLACMIDPPREEVHAAMESALKAHIRVIIITGDYALTAAAIAKKVGLSAGSKTDKITVVTGQDLKSLSDIDLLQKLIHENLIFARTSPEDKMRIVNLLKQAGEVVAVTGDGINDAPALKRADIGVAMGKTGTEVAKDSSEIVLLDDSFSTLVTAIKEGRTIFYNLKKTVLASITANGAELFSVIFSFAWTTAFGTPLAILAVQILAVDLVAELLPLMFLTWDPSQPKTMTDPPRNPNDHILTKKNFIDVAWSGLLIGALAFFNFLLLFNREGVSPVGISPDNALYMRATTLTYMTIVLGQWANIFSRRCGDESVFTSYLWSNKRLLMGYAISIIFLLNISYNPYIAKYLGTGPLSLLDWGTALIAAIVYLMVREMYKIFLRRKSTEKDSQIVKVAS